MVLERAAQSLLDIWVLLYTVILNWREAELRQEV